MPNNIPPPEFVYSRTLFNTGWTDSIATWQAACDHLASIGAASALPYTFPLPSSVGEVALLFRRGQLVINPHHTFSRILDEALPNPLPKIAHLIGDPHALSAWHDAVYSPLFCIPLLLGVAPQPSNTTSSMH